MPYPPIVWMRHYGKLLKWFAVGDQFQIGRKVYRELNNGTSYTGSTSYSYVAQNEWDVYQT